MKSHLAAGVAVAIVAEGLTNRSIAAQPGVSPHTIELHLTKRFERARLETRTELIALALRDERTGTIALVCACDRCVCSVTYVHRTRLIARARGRAPGWSDGNGKLTRPPPSPIDFLAEHEASSTIPLGMGLAVCVVKEGDVLFQGAYGLRERDRQLPVTPRSIFDICSLTKAFTATALLMACDRGQLDLERPINANRTLLPLKDPDASRDVTVLDVLSNRLGVPSNDMLWVLGAVRGDGVTRALGQLDPLPGGFRRCFVYHNLAYGALGHLFPELVGESWEARVGSAIVAPLGMRTTSFGGPLAKDAEVALPYVGTRRVPHADSASVAAAGAMRSTLEDMTRWLAFHVRGGRTDRGEQLLSQVAVDRMQSPHVSIDAPNPLLFQGYEWLLEGGLGYGLGWFIGCTGGLKAVFAPGFVDGYSTAMVLVPEKKLGFLVLTNVNGSPAPGLVIRALLGEVLEQGTSEPTKAPSALPERAVVAGTYEHSVYGTLTIVVDGDEATIAYQGHRWPLVWKDAQTASFTATAFGLAIPLPVTFDAGEGQACRASRVTIPLSMDPRVEPQVFVRKT